MTDTTTHYYSMADYHDRERSNVWRCVQRYNSRTGLCEDIEREIILRDQDHFPALRIVARLNGHRKVPWQHNIEKLSEWLSTHELAR